MRPHNPQETIMDIKAELFATALRVLSAKTNLFPQQDPTTAFINSLFGVKPQEVQLAENLSALTDEAIKGAKRASTNRKFKKITQNQ